MSNWPAAPEVLVAASPKEAVVGADIIITATTSEKPVFDGRDLSPGTHITAIGAYTPHMQEIDELAIQRVNKIVVDSLSACMAEAGDLLIPIEKNIISQADIYGEIGEIVNGEKSGRQSPQEITMFKSVGVAVQDAAAANHILRAAEAQGLGIIVEL